MSAIYDRKVFLRSARLFAASEFIVAAADAAEIVFPHPTVSEVLREAVIEAARQRS